MEKEDNDKEEYAPASIRDLMRYSTNFDWVLLISSLTFGAINGIMGPVVLVANLYLVRALLDGQSDYEKGNGTLSDDQMQMFTNKMVFACLFYLLLACILFICGFLGVLMITIVCQRQVRIIQRKFLHHVLNQDMAWLDQHQIGALTEKVSAYMDRIKDGLGDKIIVLEQGVFNLVAGCVVGFWMKPDLAAISLISAPLVILSLAASTKVSDKLIRKERKSYSEASSIAEQVLHGIQTVLAFNAQPFELTRYSRHLNDGCVSGTRKAVITSALNALYKLALFGSMGLSFWYGTKLVIEEGMKPEIVMAVYWTIVVGAIRIGFAIPNVGAIIGARLAAGEVFAIIDREPEMDCSSPKGLRPDKVDGNIQFKNIHFYYPSRPETKVVNNVSFDVGAGQKIALVGHSGCGKSTTISLLMRFYDPTQGMITLDGRPITELNVEWLRNTIGVVSQEPVIFAGTIEENLKMGKEDLTLEEMENACRMANAEEFIKKLPKGYQTMIGDGNIRLSGGQKQRLAIARALVRNPKILLLDEATSSLDNESERLVQQGLEQASSGRTTITIAHRLSTIKHSDRIFVFESGQIVEEGTHEELLKIEDGVYKRLVLAQAIDHMDEDEDESGDENKNDDDKDTNQQHKNGLSYVYKQPIESPLLYRKAWQDDSDNHLTSLSLMDSKDKNGLVDFDNKLTKLPEKPEKTKTSSLFQIYRFAHDERKLVWIGLLVVLFMGAVWPLYTILYGLLFQTLSETVRFNATNLNNGTKTKDLSGQNIRNGLLFLGLGIMAAVTRIIGGSIFGYYGQVVSKKMRIAVFKNILRQDGKFFDQPEHASGNLMTRLSSDAPNVLVAIDERLADILEAICTLIYGCAIAFFFDWKMTLIEIVCVGFICGMQILFLEVLKRRTMRDAQLGEEAIRIASEAIGQVKTVQALNRQHHFHKKFKQASITPYKRALWSAPLQAAVFGLGGCCEEVNFVLTYLAGLLMVRAGQASPFIVFQVIENVNIGLIIAGLPLATYFPYYTQALASATLMFKMMRKKVEIDSLSDQGQKPEIKGEIQLKNVEFAYPRNEEHKILKGLSLKAETAKSLALVGPSGCGKSTIIGLLEHYYNVQSGQIIIDGVDNRELNVRHLRQNLSIVSQEPNLFSLSIKENISYGVDNMSDEEVIEAARQANIHDFVKSLPMGYETLLGPRGTQISGGQRQRLSIARAIAKKPKILLFDEATSCLDTQSEKLVQESIERAAIGRTVVTVAHRLSTIQHSDLIVVLKDGRLVEQGSHTELLALKGAYYRLIEKQNPSS